MQFCFLLAALLVSVSAESVIPEQPVLTTSSACLNGCFQEGSRIFAASNLKNFETIVKNVDEFCGIYNDLMKCGQGCSEEDQAELTKRVSATVSSYICTQKLDDFKSMKDCMRSQDSSSLESCSEGCHLTDPTLQLDSTSIAIINPFVFYDSIGPVCDKTKCTLKCAIGEINKRCASAGDLFKDLGYKQVLEASARVHRDAANESAPIASQLAKIYLEALPDKCKFVIDPEIYDETFTEKEQVGSDVVTKIVPAVLLSDDDGKIEAVTPVAHKETLKPESSHEEVTTATEQPKSVEVEGDTASKGPSPTSTTVFEFEPVNEPEDPVGPPQKEVATDKPGPTISASDLPEETGVEIQEQPVPSPASVEPVPEQDQAEQTTTSATPSETTEKETEKPEVAEGEINAVTEQTIHVVNEENEHEVGNNIVHEPASAQNTAVASVLSVALSLCAVLAVF
uniref:CPG4 domain-containing protein n=1 Tax=Steinernema glaseri TaxID=37863 RepID=A0A1I8AHI8_9BILA